MVRDNTVFNRTRLEDTVNGVSPDRLGVDPVVLVLVFVFVFKMLQHLLQRRKLHKLHKLHKLV